MTLGDFFVPARLDPMGYVGECCLICGMILDDSQRRAHVDAHVAGGAIVEVVGAAPAWRLVASGVSTIAEIHTRRHFAGGRFVANVHVLHHGRALCGFSDQVPAEWPTSHWWVGLDNVIGNASCTACVDAIGTLFREAGL